MKRSSLAIAIAATLAASTALAQSSQTSRTGDTNAGTTTSSSATQTDSRSGSDRSNRASTTTSRNDSSTSSRNESANHTDEKFLKDFAHANAAEVETGRLAEQQAQHPDVKAFGKHMVEEHTKTIQKLESIASNLNVDVKAKPDLKHKAKSTMLDNKKGSDFDAAYLKSQVEDHEKVVNLLQREIREGRDASAKQLATDALPHVKEHLEKARQLQARVGEGNSASRGTMHNSSSESTRASSTSKSGTSGSSDTTSSTNRSSGSIGTSASNMHSTDHETSSTR